MARLLMRGHGHALLCPLGKKVQAHLLNKACSVRQRYCKDKLRFIYCGSLSVLPLDRGRKQGRTMHHTLATKIVNYTVGRVQYSFKYGLGIVIIR